MQFLEGSNNGLWGLLEIKIASHRVLESYISRIHATILLLERELVRFLLLECVSLCSFPFCSGETLLNYREENLM